MGKNDLFTAMIIDPPRKGLDTGFIEFIKKTKPAKISYISCNPASLVRDLKLLEDLYDIKVVNTYDMFPQTYHVETIASLVKK